MLINKYLHPFKLKFKKLVFVALLCPMTLFAQDFNAEIVSADSSDKKTKPKFNWTDSYLSRFRTDYKASPLFKLFPDSLKTKVLYQPKNSTFSIDEKLKENIDTKIPQSISFNDYSSIQNAAVRQSILRDYERLQDGQSKVSGKGLNPLLEKNPIIDRIFGGKIPEFLPNGFVSIDLTAGTRFTNNPLIALNLRRQPVFDMDQQIAVNFNNMLNGGGGNGNPDSEPNSGLDKAKSALEKVGQIKDKLGLLGNIDTKSAFSFENQLKLNYKNEPEDILQKLELGNISMQTRTQLIPGVDNLFGLKAGLRFGKLDVTAVAAQQRSRTQSILINAGAQNKPFEIRCDNYDENRHFFLSHFFRNNYEKSLRNLPMITSGIRITRVEVYITNRSNNVSSMRNIIGFSDLGENTKDGSSTVATDNAVSSFFATLNTNSSFRKIDETNQILEGGTYSFKKGSDYEILRGAKRLTDREFEFNSELGYISLLSPLRNDEVLAVSYEYTQNGKNYKVGELTEDYSIRAEDEVIMLKLLKSSTIRNRLSNPMWKLMMKNIYSLTQGQISREGFQLRVVYKDDKTGIDNPNLQESSLKDKPLLGLLNLDKLNYNNDRQPDGNFDYIENVTINERSGKIIFPVLEPFGSHLANQFKEANDSIYKKKYIFPELYSKTLNDAQQITTKNKFFIVGNVQSSSSEINLPYGASASSVKVYAGGVQLNSGTDFVVDNQTGRIRIVNQSIVNSARQIRIDYETPDLFQTQIRRLGGLRFDYLFSKNLRLGATVMNLRETTPGFLTRTSIGAEPVNNTVWGFDLNYKKNSQGLTRFLDRLPLIQTKEPSSIILNAEFAQMIPGVNNKRVNGNSMIDDFEAARNINDLSRQANKWRLGSTPIDPTFRTDATSIVNQYNDKRAKISIYSIDPSAYGGSGLGLSNNNVPDELSRKSQENIYERAFQPNEIFKGRSIQNLGLQLPSAILDISYFPAERGMYNYNTDLGAFKKNAKENFGAVMRGLTFDTDFDNSNIEYAEFWLMDPFAGEIREDFKPTSQGIKNTTGGKLLIQLGDISEDVIPDSQNNFENGLGVSDKTTKGKVLTKWGYAPNKQYITDAFDNQENTRKQQDVGLEGLSNEEEKTFGHVKTFLDNLKPGDLSESEIEDIKNDPSGDDFKYFLGEKFDVEQKSIIGRFKNYLGMENNSPVITSNDLVTPSNTTTADKEDINQDNTINEQEAYFEYEIDLKPGKLAKGNGYIIDEISSGGTNFYLFRIPIRQPKRPVGEIDGFKSIRFMRMVLTEFEQPVVLRFAALQLVANQYREYKNQLTNIPNQEVPNTYNAGFVAQAVNIEENGCSDAEPNCKGDLIPYVVPPGFVRDRDYTQQTVFQFNEQSLSLSVDNLKGGDSRAVFKNTKVDLNMYKRLKMFIHAQNKENSVGSNPAAFIRIGTDLTQNFYQIEIPKVTVSDSTAKTPEKVWLAENELDIPLDALRNLKINRNKKAPEKYDTFYDENIPILGTRSENEEPILRNYKISVVGNPDLSNILSIMMGVKNPDSKDISGKGFTLWFDELRANGFDTQKGEAGILSADIKLADLGTIMLNGSFNNYGFGTIQDRISTRSRESNLSYGISTALELDKLLPQKWGLSIPFFWNFDRQIITPHFDPLNPDLVLSKSGKKNDYLDKVVDETTRRGFNFTNIHKVKTNTAAKNHFYDIENFGLSFAKNEITRQSILLDDYTQAQQKGGISYLYSPKGISWEPFKSSKKLNKPRYTWLKEFNLSPIPTLISFKIDFDRSYIRNWYRDSTQNASKDGPNVIKYFYVNKFYDLQWNLAKSLTVNYSAKSNAIVDEDKNSLGLVSDARLLKEEFSFKEMFSNNRTKNYNQTINATYKIPLDKIYFLDWMVADARYANSFNYRANSYNLREINDDGSDGGLFGDFLENGQEIGLQGRVDLVKLYNKVKYLKFANSPSQPLPKFTRTPGDDEDVPQPKPEIGKKFTRMLMAVRGINISYSEKRGTLMPGFDGNLSWFGTFGKGSLPFVLGSQKNKGTLSDGNSWANIFEKNRWLTDALTRNDPFLQIKVKKFEYGTSVEPFKGFRLQIKGNVNRGDDYQFLYKKGSDGVFGATNLVRNGNFSMSFWSFKTLFQRVNKDTTVNKKLYQYSVFDDMNDYRDSLTTLFNTNIKKKGGEGTYSNVSQDILIPAFFAAYSGKKDIKGFYDKITEKQGSLRTPFLGWLPLPNWRFDYTGIDRLKPFKKKFSSITLSHSYTSTYSVGNYTSSLDYQSDNLLNLLVSDYKLGDKLITRQLNGGPINTFTPVLIMSTINLDERFSPLMGIQFTTKKNITGRAEWNKERKASLNLSNTQIAEYHSDDFVFGLGFRRKDVKIPFRGRDGNRIVLKNDLNFRFDVTFRDIISLQRKLDGEAIVTQGNKNVQIRPQIQYQFNKRFSGSFYVERLINSPYNTLSFYQSSTIGGLNVRFNLSE